MAEYRRFVAYVYEYLKGKKGSNCGFIRVEAWGKVCRMEIHLRCPGLLAGTECSVYGFVRKKGLLDGSRIGNCRTEEGKMDCLLETETMAVGHGKIPLGEMNGMVLILESGGFFGTEWDDQLIRPEDFRKCHDLLREYGMQTSEQDMDAEELESVYEVPYGKKGSLIYIELHKSLFPPESEAYGDLNRFFANVHEDAIDIRIDGTDIRTMGYTDHLFYLICHSFKHFLHSGFGIRQVCDIILFANEYGDAIDWEKVLRQCREIHADLFAAALFAIGEKYLTFDPEKAHYPKVWQEISVDETDMLMDLLDSGIYGNANMSRKHSSNMTLDAVAADKNGKKAGNTVLKSLFPSAKKLEGRYPYLKKHPILLPIAWTDRILKYRKETVAGGDNAAADSVKIGNQRIELMKKYGIIKK